MYRMHGKDSVWLTRETPVSMNHTLKIFVLDTGDGKADMGVMRKVMTAAVLKMPMFRQRPIDIPWGLHHPVMINDPDFNLDFHLNRAALPNPATRVELDEMIGQIASSMLDRNHPLWEAWVIEGMDQRYVTIVMKIHHALADGMASVGFIKRLFDGEFPDPARDNFVPDPIPGKWRLVWDAIKDHIRYDIRNFPSFVVEFAKNIRDTVRYSKVSFSPMVRSITEGLPRTRFNYGGTVKRNFATVQLPIEDLKEVKNKLGGTLNDAFLALAAGTYRRYFLLHDELPDVPICAAVPVAVDERGAVREFGNNFSTMMAFIPVHIEDPLKRYAETRKFMQLAKDENAVMGKETWNKMVHYTPPGMWRWALMKDYRQRAADKPDYTVQTNVLLSNVPGPRERLGNMSSLFSVGPIADGITCNITLWSYVDQVNISVLACRKSLPDIRRFVQCMEESLDELKTLARNSEAA